MVDNTETGLKPLTDWKKEPTLYDLQLDLTECRSTQNEHISNLTTWDDNMNAKGSAAITPVVGRSKIVPKLIRKQAEWRYASLSEPFLSAEKLFDVAPVTWEDTDAARQNSLVLNNQFDTKINKVAFIDEYVRTAVDEGTVIVKTGWEYLAEEVEEEKPIYEAMLDESVIPEYEQYMQLQTSDPQAFDRLPEEVKLGMQMSQENQQPIRVVVTGTKVEMVTKVLANHPTVSVRDSRNLFIDPTCEGDYAKAGFIIESFETSKSDLKLAGIYKNLDKIDLNSTQPLAQPDHTITGKEAGSFKFADEARKKIVAYEYWGNWDIDGSGVAVPIVATWVGSTFIRMELNPYPDKKPPYTFVQYLPVRKSIYGEPDGALLEDNQKVLGALIRGMVDAMGRSANAQTGIAKGMLDPTNKRKFERGSDYEYNPNYDPRLHVHSHSFPDIPNSALSLVGIFSNDADSMTGVKAFSQGIQGNSLGGSGTTSAAVRGVLDAASKREAGILRRLAQGVIEIGRKIISLNAVLLDEEQVVRVTNDTFIPVRRDDLAGNVDLRLTISTAEADEAKAQELSFMLQTIGSNMDPGMTKMILVEIAKLRKAPLLAKQIEDYQPQPDPMAEQMKQLEMEYRAAETALLNAQAEEIMSKLPYYQAKAGVEEARAQNLQASADNSNLKFMEKAGGIDHDREMQKQANEHKAMLAAKELDGRNALANQQSKREGALDVELLKSGLSGKIPQQPVQSFAEGGLITGFGSSRSDSIRANMQQGSFILPADVTKSAGSEKLKELGKVPVNVSNGEFHMTPEQVYAVGLNALTAIKDGVLDVGDFWSKDNQRFEDSNPTAAERLSRASNPMTSLGSAIGSTKDAAERGNGLGVGLAALSSLPLIGGPAKGGVELAKQAAVSVARKVGAKVGAHTTLDITKAANGIIEHENKSGAKGK